MRLKFGMERAIDKQRPAAYAGGSGIDTTDYLVYIAGMPRDGTQTRERILDSANELALTRGLSATSLDQIIEGAGITKGAFFYHFKNKEELGDALVTRFAGQDHALFAEATARVEKLSRDPLQQALLLVGLGAEMFEQVPENPGCLMASYCYQGDFFNETARRLCAAQFTEWSDWLEARLKQAVKKHPLAVKTDLRQLAELFQSVIEGGFILARTYADKGMIRKQIIAYRDLLEAMFKQR